MTEFRTFMLAWTCMALLIIAVGACKDSGRVADDPEFNYQSGERVVLRVHLYDTRAELNDAYKVFFPKGNKRMLGFARPQRNISTREPSFCDLYLVKTPYAEESELKVWGHELKHCLEGKFHPPNLDR